MKKNPGRKARRAKLKKPSSRHFRKPHVHSCVVLGQGRKP